VKAMIGLITNSIELYTIPLFDHNKEKLLMEIAPRKLNVVDIHGHRSVSEFLCFCVCYFQALGLMFEA
jgi:hypothetical protein